MPPRGRATPPSPGAAARGVAFTQASTIAQGFVSVGVLTGTVAVNNLTLRVIRRSGFDLPIAAAEMLVGGIIGANLIAAGFGAEQPATMVALGLLAGGTAHIVEQTFS